MSLDQSMEDIDISSPSEIVMISDGLPVSTVVNVALNDGMSGGAASTPAVVYDGTAQPETSSKRKRGRPRKDQSPVHLSSLMLIESSETVSQKRGRGRPPGSGKFQRMAANSSGDFAMNSLIGKFTPHAMTIQAGEDIVEKLHSFFKGSSRSICVLSGMGPISFVQIKSETSYDGVLNHQGRFELLNMSGSYSFGESTSKNKIISMSVFLGNPDGRVFGGVLAGSLVAADEVHLIVGSFKHGIKCKFPKKMPFGVPVNLAKEEVLIAKENGVMDKQQAADCSNIKLQEQVPMKEEDPLMMKEEDPLMMKEEDPMMKKEELNSDVAPILLKDEEMELQNDSKPADFVPDEMINNNVHDVVADEMINNNNVHDIADEMIDNNNNVHDVVADEMINNNNAHDVADEMIDNNNNVHDVADEMIDNNNNNVHDVADKMIDNNNNNAHDIATEI